MFDCSCNCPGWVRLCLYSHWTWSRTGCSWAVRAQRPANTKPAFTLSSLSWRTRVSEASTLGRGHFPLLITHPITLLICVCALTCVCVRLSAGLLRQATYTTTRLGIYTILFEKMTGSDGRPPSFIMKVTLPCRCSPQLFSLSWLTAHSPCRHWSVWQPGPLEPLLGRQQRSHSSEWRRMDGETQKVTRTGAGECGCHGVSVCLQSPCRTEEGIQQRVQRSGSHHQRGRSHYTVEGETPQPQHTMVSKNTHTLQMMLKAHL